MLERTLDYLSSAAQNVPQSAGAIAEGTRDQFGNVVHAVQEIGASAQQQASGLTRGIICYPYPIQLFTTNHNISFRIEIYS